MSQVKQIGLMMAMSCMFLVNIGVAQTETQPEERALSKFEQAVLNNEHFSDEDKQKLLDYYEENKSSMIGDLTPEERQAVIDQQIDNQRKYLKELDHQKELFGDRANKNDAVYKIIETALAMNDQEPIPRPDPDASSQEKIDYHNALKERLKEKRELAEQNFAEIKQTIKGGKSMLSFDHLKDENGKIKPVDLKEELDKIQEDAQNNQLQGDSKTACEVILCLSTSKRPGECSPPIQDYLTKTIDHKNPGNTIPNRINFLKLCPTTDDQDVAELAMGHATLGERCNLALYNTPRRTISYNALDPLSDKKPLRDEDILTITVIDSAINPECKAYIEHEMMDLYLTPFRKYHNETLTIYETPYNPTFDAPVDKRRTKTSSFGQVWDLDQGELFDFGSWYYEKPLEQ